MNHHQYQDIPGAEYYARRLLDVHESINAHENLSDITLPPLTLEERYLLREYLMEHLVLSELLLDALTAPKPPTRKERILARLKSLLKK